MVFLSKNITLGVLDLNIWVKVHGARKGRFGATFDSVGDEASGVFESHFLALLQGVFPQNHLAIRRSSCILLVRIFYLKFSFLRHVTNFLVRQIRGVLTN